MILLQILDNFNASNFTQNVVQNSLNPYLVLLGDLFWGIFFGFMIAAIYVSGDGDPKIYLSLMAFLVIIAIIFVVLLPFYLIAIFGMLLSFIVSGVLFKTFVEART